MARVAIVIVTHNSGSEIGGCLDAIAQLTDVEIVVVDNHSGDATREKISRRQTEKIRLISNPGNAGFAAAVNQGVRATSADLVLLLNPDAWIERGVEALAGLFDQPKTGAAGGLLVDAAGAPQRGFMFRNLPGPAALMFEVWGINRMWPGNPVNWHYRCLGLDTVTPLLVEQAGAFFMFSREAWNQVGGFDERFWPVWFEDVDFCAKLRRADYRIWFHPGAVAKHTGAHSVGALSLENRERYWYGNLLEYSAKYHRPLAFRGVCFAVASSSVVRAVIGCGRVGLKAFAVYGSVCRLAVSRMFHLRHGTRSSAVKKQHLP